MGPLLFVATFSCIQCAFKFISYSYKWIIVMSYNLELHFSQLSGFQTSLIEYIRVIRA